MTKRKIESTEKDQMKRLIICKLCHETLEDAIILPCGKTICSKHLVNETNNFKCNLCDNSNDKTLDKFPFNEELNDLVYKCDVDVDFSFDLGLGKEYKLAKEQLKHLNDSINEKELFIKDPEFYINDYFNKLIIEIDFSKEQLIESIEQKYEQIMNQLKGIETKCKQNAQNKELNSKLDQTIKAAKQNLDEWTETLESKLNREDCCIEISKKSSQSISELKYETNKCQVAFLDNKEYKFNSILIEDPIFGDLVTNDVEIIDESRLESTIRFEIKDFSKFCIIDEWFVVDNIPWLIGVDTKKRDDDIYLEILYKPLKVASHILRSNPIKTVVSIKFIKTDGEEYGQKICFRKFVNKTFFRFCRLISLKDLMDPSNSLFNEQTNSVTIEAQIKITEFLK